MVIKYDTHYECLKRKKIFQDDFCLLSVRRQDIDQIRLWRNAQLNVLRQNKEISEREQIDYYENNIFPEFREDKPKNIIFSFLKNNSLVAYGGLVHIEWKHFRAEVSFLVDTKIAGTKEDYNDLLPSFLSAIKDVAFNDLKLIKLTAELYDIRPNYKKTLISSDFIIEDVLKNHVMVKNDYKDSIIFSCINNN